MDRPKTTYLSHKEGARRVVAIEADLAAIKDRLALLEQECDLLRGDVDPEPDPDPCPDTGPEPSPDPPVRKRGRPRKNPI